MADNVLKFTTDVGPAPTECVMIKEEPDIDLEYDPNEQNTIDHLADDDVEMQLNRTNIGQAPLYHGSYLLDSNKRKADDDFQPGLPTGSRFYTVPTPDATTKPPPKKKPARTYQKNPQQKTNQKNATTGNNEEDENALRVKYLMNATETEERIRTLQMELHKARLEREKMELENIREMHNLRLENLKLEKEILAMKLKNGTESGVC